MYLKFYRFFKAKSIAFLMLGLLAVGESFLGRHDKKSATALSHYIMGSIYSSRAEIDKAIDEFKKAVNLNPDSATLHLRLAVEYVKKKPDNLAKAIAELKTAIRLEPEAIEPHLILALIYSYQGHTDLANQEYEIALNQARKDDPQNIEIYKGLGEVYLQQKKLENAIDAYKMIINLSSKDAEAHFYLGTIYLEQKKRQEAIIEFKEAIRLNPDYAEALNSLAYTYAEDGIHLDEAEAYVKKALEFEPNNAAYIDTLGWIYFKKNKLDEAIKHLEQARQLADDPVILDHLGDAYFKKNLFERAREMWEASLKLDPNQEEVKKKLESLKKK